MTQWASAAPRDGIYRCILISLDYIPPDQLDNISFFTSPATSVNRNLRPWVL
jgi:hypothetical protein